MGSPKSTDEEFIAAWRSSGGRAKDVAARFDMAVQKAYERRNKVESKYGISLPSAGDSKHTGRGDAGTVPYNYNPRISIDGFTGRMIVFSDAHWWPGISDTLAYRALIEIIKEYKPKLIIANGDILDGAKVSRFPPDGWENRPRMADELDEVKSRMAEIRHAYRGAQHIRTIGNHDTRFDRYLAVNAGEFEGIGGFRLADHLTEWKECVSVFVNGHTVIKHRFGNGQHAAYMATLRAGTNTFSGHTHRLLTTPWGDYNGRRYGNETGTLAEIGGPQFAYTEDAPTTACSGFMMATFTPRGDLLYPEPCEVRDGVAWFRGQVVVRNREKASKNARIAA